MIGCFGFGQTPADGFFHDVGDGSGQTRGFPHLGPKLAVLDGMGLGLPEVMKQGTASDQLEIEQAPVRWAISSALAATARQVFTVLAPLNRSARFASSTPATPRSGHSK